MARVEETMIICSCSDHCVGVSAWTDGDCYLTLWSPIQSKDWSRWYWAWQSLKGRWRGGSEVVLDIDHVVQLRDALNKHLASQEP